MLDTQTRTEKRKDEHLEICKTREVSSLSQAGWDQIRLPHCALPEFDYKDIDISCEFLGNHFKYPFLISSMTGGSPKGEATNEILCEFASARQIPMGVGSQRVALENRQNPELFGLRKRHPKAILFANIGIVQFNYGVEIEDCEWLIEKLEARALILHANVLQECIQNEGNRNFSKLFEKISALKKILKVPVILKETGCGLDAQTCVRAREAGADAIDIAGLGGTHWGFIEGLRSPNRLKLGELFRDWGIPTVEALQKARAALGPKYPIIASGGLRSGLDAAKAIHLGAQLCGMALPFLKTASEEGIQGLNEFLDLHAEALKIAFFCSGAKDLKALQKDIG